MLTLTSIKITTELVCTLIHSQFPKWSNLSIRPVAENGHDNRTYRLGDELTVRLPSDERYAAAVEKELRWLPAFKQHLTMQVPVPVGKGEPTEEYPLPWSVNRWIEGETVKSSNVSSLIEFASDLAGFLRELESIDATDGIPAGIQNFHRGGDLSVYDSETRSAMESVASVHDRRILTEIWELALSTKYSSAPVWVHGDVAVGNLLVRNGRLCGVIDFGTMGVGDPSSDLVVAWNLFDDQSRKRFLDIMGFGMDVLHRARGWALWKALITYNRNPGSSREAHWGKRAIDVIIQDYRHH